MSFEDLKKDELLEAVEIFGTDVRPSATKADIIAALLEDGIDYDTYTKFKAKDDDEDDSDSDDESEDEKPAKAAKKEEDEEPVVLVRMTRGNGTFEVRGYRFTREHPYALVKESDADYLFDEIGGFRVATPREAKEFYN